MEIYGFLDTIPKNHRIPLVFSPVLICTDTKRLMAPPFIWDGDTLVFGQELTIDEFEGTTVPWQKAIPDYCLYSPPHSLNTQYVSVEYAAREIQLFVQLAFKLGDNALRAALEHYEDASSAGQTPESYARMLLMPISRKRRERMLQSLKTVATLDPPSLHVEEVMKEVFKRR